MPQRVICEGCGEILYEGKDIKSPEEIHQMHDGKCPKCGRRLSLIPHKVEVLPAKRLPR